MSSGFIDEFDEINNDPNNSNASVGVDNTPVGNRDPMTKPKTNDNAGFITKPKDNEPKTNESDSKGLEDEASPISKPNGTGADLPEKPKTNGEDSQDQPGLITQPTDTIRASPEVASRRFCKDVKIVGRAHTSIGHADIETPIFYAVVTTTDKLWLGTNVKIKYSFVPGKLGGNARQRAKVKDAIQEWTWYANVIFEEIDAGGDVRVAFDSNPSEGSWSLVGTECKGANGPATMNLGWIGEDSAFLTASERAVVLHEFGHVLGMLHEHQSPSGGGVPLKNVDGAIKYYGDSRGWDRKTVEDQVIREYNMKDVSSFSEVDRLSIMQYPMPASVTGLDHDIDYNYHLSELDKAYMCIMYPRVKNLAHAKAPEWTFQYALAKTGMVREDPEAAQQLINAYFEDTTPNDELNPTRIRRLFRDWCIRAHLHQTRTGPVISWD